MTHRCEINPFKNIELVLPPLSKRACYDFLLIFGNRVTAYYKWRSQNTNRLIFSYRTRCWNVRTLASAVFQQFKSWFRGCANYSRNMNRNINKDSQFSSQRQTINTLTFFLMFYTILPWNKRSISTHPTESKPSSLPFTNHLGDMKLYQSGADTGSPRLVRFHLVRSPV